MVLEGRSVSLLFARPLGLGRDKIGASEGRVIELGAATGCSNISEKKHGPSIRIPRSLRS